MLLLLVPFIALLGVGSLPSYAVLGMMITTRRREPKDTAGPLMMQQIRRTLIAIAEASWGFCYALQGLG